MLLMHSKVINLYAKESFSNAVETRQRDYRIPDSFKLGFYFVLKGDCKLSFKVTKFFK